MKDKLRIVISFLISALIFLMYASYFSRSDSNTFGLENVFVPAVNSENIVTNKTYQVTKVIDGDTIQIAGGMRIRYIGIDTPETVDPRRPVGCFAREASMENKKLMLGKSVRLEKDVSETDTFGRLLRYVYLGDIFINDYLVRKGYAHAVSYPPDVMHQELFYKAEQEARDNNRGLWAGCSVNSDNSSFTTNYNVTASPNASSNTCSIKGNISSEGEKIYHVTGCESYDKTAIDESNGERWFCTESEAITVGWRKAQNCP